MNKGQVEQVRRFNRVVTQHVGALEDSYLQRGRPLGQARLRNRLRRRFTRPSQLVTQSTLADRPT